MLLKKQREKQENDTLPWLLESSDENVLLKKCACENLNDI